jgi:hypothetical protein
MGERVAFDGSSPFALLGLSADATPDQITQARRRLAKSLHPDRGGDAMAMQQLNAAFDAAMAIATAPRIDVPPSRLTADVSESHLTADVPSFTIEALPAVAHMALLEALDGIATVVADDPPYLIEVELLGSIVHDATSGPPIGWARLDLVPDAGSTSVSLTLASSKLATSGVGIDSVRNVLIDRLNALDWSELTT